MGWCVLLQCHLTTIVLGISIPATNKFLVQEATHMVLLSALLATSPVKSAERMDSMFFQCPSFTGDDLASWNVSSARTMGHMFRETAFEGEGLEDWDGMY